ncbi:MAG: outer membrane protein assembly factor BamA, partial [Deltaproteobacteria bacterium]
DQCQGKRDRSDCGSLLDGIQRMSRKRGEGTPGLWRKSTKFTAGKDRYSCPPFLLRFLVCPLAGIFVFVSCLFCQERLLFAQPQATSTSAASSIPTVSSITIKGNRVLSEEAIRKVMLTREKTLFSSEDTGFLADRFASDIDRVVSLYRSAGYYDAKVEGKVEEEKEKNAVNLQLVITEGMPVRIASFTIESPVWPSWLLEKLEARAPEPGASAVVRPAADFPALPLHEGDIFDVAKYNDAKKMLELPFADHGYARVVVQGSNKIFRQEHQADVQLVVHPGKQFTVGSLLIEGNATVADYLILREMRLTPGDLFSLSKIMESYHRLHDVDLFRSVVIEPDWQHETGNAVPLRITVEEKPPRGIKLGAGYGTEDKFRALAQIRWRNFLGRGYTVSLTGKYSGLGHSLGTAFENPYLLGRADLKLSYSLGYERQVLESYQNDQYYSKVRLDKELSGTSSLYAGHNLEANSTSNLTESLSSTVLEIFGRVEEQNFLLSSLEIGGLFSSVDDKISPTSGMSLFYSLEGAAIAIGSEFEFLRQKIEWRGYYAPLDKLVIALRTTAGTVDPIHTTDYIPISKRFFAGGSNSVRGYAYQDLGEKDQLGEPIGGYSLFEASAELRFPLLWKLKGVLFLDGGNIFTDPYQFDVADLRYGGGFGFRYLTPVGPIRVDLAYKLNPETSDEQRFRLHLNLGEAF